MKPSAELLQAVFRFKNQGPSSTQTEAFCEELKTALKHTVSTILATSASGAVLEESVGIYLDPEQDDRVLPLDHFSKLECALLKRAWKQLEGLNVSRQVGDVWTLQWFPQYAGVLHAEHTGVGSVMLRVLALDSWGWTRHFLASGECVDSAVPASHVVLTCGNVPAKSMGVFSANFTSELRAAQLQRGSKRSAVHADQDGLGHQKTPQFLVAVVRTAIDKTIGATPTVHVARGGTTDVGLHTGGAARDTCWPLVKAALDQALPPCTRLARKVELQFIFELLTSQLDELSSTVFNENHTHVVAFWDKVGVCFEILEKLVEQIVDLDAEGYDSQGWRVNCADVRRELNAVAEAWTSASAQLYRLPQLASNDAGPLLPTLSCPHQEPFDVLSLRTRDVRKLDANTAAAGEFAFMEPSSCTLESLYEFVSTIKAGDTIKSSIGSRLIEDVLIARSELLEIAHPHEQCDPELLLKIVTWYRDQIKPGSTTTSIEERSMSVILSWITMCLVHRACAQEHPTLATHAIALDWRRLDICVVRERRARGALRRAAQYVCKHNSTASRPPVFDLKQQRGTIQLARAMGKAIDVYAACYRDAQTKWEAACEATWASILSRKQQLATVRDEITTCETELYSARSQLAAEESRLREDWRSRNSELVQNRKGYWYKPRMPRYLSSDTSQRLNQVVAERSNYLAQKQTKRKRLEQMPEFLVSPLPFEEDDALEVMFLMAPPPSIAILAELVWRAQRSLYATSEATDVHILSDAVSWRDHFDKYRRGCSLPFPTRHLIAFPDHLSVPSSFGLSSVDSVGSQGAFEAANLWFPSSANTLVHWRDSWYCDAWTNPFVVSEQVSRCQFTPQLAPVDGFDWQWAIVRPDQAALQRGNAQYAHWGGVGKGAEGEDSPLEFICRGSLRAFPHQQLRRVYACVQADTLSWSDPIVEGIVRLALHQVGEFRELDSGRLCFDWHQDLEDHAAIAGFIDATRRLVLTLEHSPRRWKSLSLVIEIAGFLCQHSGEAVACLLELVAIARRWATELTGELHREGLSIAERDEFRTRICILHGYAVLAFDVPFGPSLSHAQAVAICKLLVQFHHAKLFVSSEGASLIHQLSKRIDRMMAARISQVVACVEASTSTNALLTGLCRLTCSTVSTEMRWNRVATASQSCCYVATDPTTRTGYFLNLFSGAIVTDGELPGGLPATIKNCAMYRTMFGDKDFEVTSSNGVYKTTTRDPQQRLFQFRLLGKEEELAVEELRPECTLQTCPRDWHQAFAQIFPARLGELYSAWFWFEQEVVLLRGPRATQTEVYYVIAFDSEHGVARCYDIPREDVGLEYSLIASRLDQYSVFIVADPQLTKVFSKFEASPFIHTTLRSDSTLDVYLPRFGLRFLQDKRGRLASVDHRGFVLTEMQQLESGLMPRFRQYLVLKNSAGDVRLLIPQGIVGARGGSGWVNISLPDSCQASVETSAVDYHARLRLWIPSSLESRAQLAAIFCASGSRLPWKAVGMTGAEAAIKLLRGCVPSRPLSSCAISHLLSIVARFAFRSPVITRLVALLIDKSKRLSFLFEDAQESEVPMRDLSNAIDEYRATQSDPRRALLYPRCQRLTTAEERDLLGSADATLLLHARSYGLRDKVVELDVPGFEDTLQQMISMMEHTDTLRRLLTRNLTSKEPATTPSFPLSLDQRNTMSECMIAELHDSWRVFHISPAQWALAVTPAEFIAAMQKHVAVVDSECKQLVQMLQKIITAARASDRDRLLDTVSRFATLKLDDVMHCVLEKDKLLDIAPCLSKQGRALFHTASLALLERCVLKDKLDRLLCMDTRDPRIVDELLASREWSSSEYPYWLAFEVEGRLQIRHEQFVIAQHLISNPGSICQLNMGRGKTRVILPMLFLHFSYTSRGQPASSKIARAHFLSPLLSETREFMWRVLTAGVLSLPFVELPFHRGFHLGVDELQLMRHCLEEAKRNGAIVMVAPEHRLSLELKRVEISQVPTDVDPEAAGKVALLDEVLQPLQYVDIFDESDALLHFGYHLVYANGASAPLDSGPDRWLVAEAILRVLMSPTSSRVRQILEQFPQSWSFQPEYSERYGSGGGIFNGFRLCVIPGQAAATSDGDEGFEMRLREAVVEHLMDYAPFELQWLRAAGASGHDTRRSVVKLLTDASLDVNDTLASLPSLVAVAKQQLLALRGLLAFSVLETSLRKRYRVDYGHAPPDTRPKAIAVPYKAADMPTQRSEFSHPDVGITLTLLAFYHSGLEDSHIRRAFEVLLTLDPSERTRYYSDWFRSVQCAILDPRERAMLANLEHLSLDSVHQVAALCKTYRFSTEVINFYLNTCVFPSDTRQFPERMSRSAWDLVRGPTNIGFSGTKDSHHLLPLRVEQREPDEPHLQGTDGKMLQLLLDSTRGYQALMTSTERDDDVKIACWQSLLLLALDKDCHAVIDTGALLAGVSNDQAAAFLMAQPGFQLQGVTYYDTRPDFDAWMVVEKDRSVQHYHKNSSLRECDTFVLFDEVRTRGSDMKLLPQAVAMLTLGPTLTKDKLMQGAGRLRQLGKHQQTLWLTSTSEVCHSIRQLVRGAATAQDNGFSITDVLNWVVDNTQRQCTLGLLEWADSGIQYTAKEADVVNETQADDWTLEGQYASAQTEQFIHDIISVKLERTLASTEATVATSSLAQQLESKSLRFGQQDVVCVSSFGEECEREMQVEEEQQEERVVVRYSASPRAESTVQRRVLFRATSVTQLGGLGCEIVGLQHAARQWLKPVSCRAIAWASTKIHATTNFWATVNSRDAPWTSFLRFVEAMLVFPDGSVLLLSEREQDEVLSLLFAARAAPPSLRGGQFALVHLPFIVGHVNQLDTAPASLSIAAVEIPTALGWDGERASVPRSVSVPLLAVVACCLLSGQTDLFLETPAAPAAETALQTLLAPLAHREEALRAFISLRGFPSRWKRSPLHQFAVGMDLHASQQATISPLTT